MIRSFFRTARVAEWAAGISIPVLCAGVVLAQQVQPPPAAPVTKTATEQAAEAAKAPAPKDAAAVELDKKVMAEIANKSELMKNLSYLSNVIGPRMTGTAALKKANDWTAEKMKEYGLTNVHLEPWEIPLGWERVSATMKMTEPYEKTFLVAAAAWSPGTKGKVSGPVVVLDGLTREQMDKYKGKLKNAVVITRPPSTVPSVIGGPEATGGGGRGAGGGRGGRGGAGAPGGAPTTPPAATPDKKGDLESDGQPPAAQPPTQPPAGGFPQGGGRGGAFQAGGGAEAFAREEGAAAVLIDSGKPHSLLVMTGSWGRGGGAGGEPPPDGMARLYIPNDQYGILYRMCKEHKVEPKCEVEVVNKFTKGPITCYNTVGDIVGSEKPDEIVVMGAHLDSWDLGTGTTDNGTGSSVVLESARVLSEMAKQGFRPKRTIRFILFSGEEQGLHGSRQYCIRHEKEMDKHVACLVHDTGTGKVNSFGALGRVKVQQMMAGQLDTLKEVGFNGIVSGGMSGGTDHASFNAVGVPGFACMQDQDEYRWTHHTQSDTFDKAKHPNLIQGAQVMAVTALRIANLPEMLPKELPAGGGRGGGRGGRGGEPPTPPAVKPPDKKGG